MKNKYTVKLRKVINANSNSNYTNNNNKEILPSINNDKWKEFVAQSINGVLEHIKRQHNDFYDNIKGLGFYINNTWFSIDENGNVIAKEGVELNAISNG